MAVIVGRSDLVVTFGSLGPATKAGVVHVHFGPGRSGEVRSGSSTLAISNFNKNFELNCIATWTVLIVTCESDARVRLLCNT